MTEPNPVDVPPAPRSAVLCSPWASPADIPETRRDLLSDSEWERVIMWASEILFLLSGSQFMGGGCTETATLRSNPPMNGTGAWPYSPTWGSCGCWSLGIWADGILYPPARGVYTGHHYSPMAVQLPRSPITGITSVTVNGQSFAAWRMLRAGWVERTDGKPWQVCHDTTVITYTFGDAPPEMGVNAAVELAVQIALGMTGNSACKLPQRVQSLTRQGVTIAMLDPQDFLREGRTGIYVVDLFLSAINPYGNRRRARVWSPDLPSAHIQ